MASFRCYDNSDVKPYDKFSSISNKTMVAIFPNVCLWRRSYAQNWEVLTLKNCYSIEPPSYASTAYVVASFGLVSFPLFRKNLGNLREFFGQIVYRPPWQKIARTTMVIVNNNSPIQDYIHPDDQTQSTFIPISLFSKL